MKLMSTDLVIWTSIYGYYNKIDVSIYYVISSFSLKFNVLMNAS